MDMPRFSRIRSVGPAFVLVTTLVSLAALTGCGVGAGSTAAPSEFQAAAISGKLNGGPNPIIGSTIRAYTTGTAYGTGVLRDTAYTDSTGTFTLSGDYSCPSGQFLYLTAVGGNTGASNTPGAGATATATISGGVVSGLTLTASGGSYTGANVSIVSRNQGGQGATATAVVDTNGASPTFGQVTGLTLVNGGSGYTTAPNVVITPAATSGTANSAAVLVAAIGRCDDVFAGGTYSGSFVTINELTTIAAAYALSGFSSAPTVGGDTIVGIGAPVKNNAATGTATAAAGLRHAFQNAANLVDVQGPSAMTARSTTVGFTQATAPIVPRELINAIGNTLVACVNSANNANAAAACTTVFSAGTTSTNTPANIFQAMVNIAQHPALSFNATSGKTAAATFLNTATAQTTVYFPNLGTVTGTTAPTDLGLAIVYPTGSGAGTGYPLTGGATPTTGAAQGVTFPDDVALDVNDNVYVLNSSGDTTTTNAEQNVLTFTSNGQFISATADNTLVKTGQRIALDTAGYVWTTNSNGGATGLERYGNSSGVLSAATAVPVAFGSYGLAVDQANNVWAGVNSNGATAAALDEITTSAGVSTVAQAGTVPSPAANLFDILVTPNQNIVVAADATGTATGGFVYVQQNTGTAAAPTYTSASNVVSAGSPTQKSPYGLYYVNSATPSLFGSNNVNSTNAGGLYPYALTYSGDKLTAVGAPGTPLNGTGTGYQATTYGKVDGLFNAISVQSTTNKIIVQPLGSTTSFQVFGCASTSGTCVNPISNPQALAVDSAGAIWIANRGATKGTASTGSLIQVLGVAAPSWPQSSVGLTGEPQ